jgi:aspartate ammonia-lyase
MITPPRWRKEAVKTGVRVRELVLRDKLLTEKKLEKVLDPFAMTEPMKTEW